MQHRNAPRHLHKIFCQNISLLYQFIFLFCFRFTDNITKDGDTIKYTINVRKLYEPGDIITFVREYEDLQVN